VHQAIGDDLLLFFLERLLLCGFCRSFCHL
jgi:hypothetical protein